MGHTTYQRAHKATMAQHHPEKKHNNKKPDLPNWTHAPSLQPVLIQELLINPADHPRGQAHLSAASGLVRRGRRLVVVADDELHLGLFEEAKDSDTPAAPGVLMRLLEGELPEDKGQRKKAKPDLEVLALLPPLPGCSAGAMLALGSGSKPRRETGVLLLPLDVQGAPNGRMARVDLSPLYVPLRKRFTDLNIEGALVVSGELLLLQRGNQADARSAAIRYDWNLIAPWLAGVQPQPPAHKSIQVLTLGRMHGVPLSLTDGVALQGGAWMFCAVAERTDNSVLDGECVGSAIGIVTPDGTVSHVYPLQGAPKVEGIAVQADGDDWLVTLVTDPDDPAIASQVLRVRLARHVATC